MSRNSFNPFLNTPLRHLPLLINPLFPHVLSYRLRSLTSRTALHIRPSRLNGVEIGRVTWPQQFHHIPKVETPLLSLVLMRWGSVLLNNGFWASLLTMECKR